MMAHNVLTSVLSTSSSLRMGREETERQTMILMMIIHFLYPILS